MELVRRLTDASIQFALVGLYGRMGRLRTGVAGVNHGLLQRSMEREAKAILWMSFLSGYRLIIRR